MQERFPSARVVKSLNQLGYHQLEEHQPPQGSTRPHRGRRRRRRPRCSREVLRVLDRLGFDPVDAGPLANGLALEPDGSPIAATYSADELSKRVSRQVASRFD